MTVRARPATLTAMATSESEGVERAQAPSPASLLALPEGLVLRWPHELPPRIILTAAAQARMRANILRAIKDACPGDLEAALGPEVDWFALKAK